MKNTNVIKTFFFAVSPVLAMPGVLYGVHKKSQFSINLIVLFIGILSFLYIPHFTNDRARYFELYEFCRGASLPAFWDYLQLRPDFFLHSLIFIFSKIGIPMQFLLMGITMFTVKILFWTFNLITVRYGIQHISNQAYFLSFLLVLFSISLPTLLSGIRFYFGCSFVLAGFNYALLLQQRIKGFLLLIIADTIHFSTVLFLPILGMLVLFPNFTRLYQILLVCSICFMFVPETIVNSLINSLNPTERYTTKVDAYVGAESIFNRAGEQSQNAKYSHLGQVAWSYAMYVYLLFTLGRKSFFRNPLYLILSVINIFYVYTVVYDRYMLFAKFIFVYMIIDEYIRFKRRSIIYVTLGFFIMCLGVEIIISRYNISESFFSTEMLSMIFTFFKRITPGDFLNN